MSSEGAIGSIGVDECEDNAAEIDDDASLSAHDDAPIEATAASCEDEGTAIEDAAAACEDKAPY